MYINILHRVLGEDMPLDISNIDKNFENQSYTINVYFKIVAKNSIVESPSIRIYVINIYSE